MSGISVSLRIFHLMHDYVWWSILTFSLELEFHYPVKNFISALNSPLDLCNVTVSRTYTISARQRTAYRVTRHTNAWHVCLCVHLRPLIAADTGALISRESLSRHSKRHLGYIRLVLVHRPCTYVHGRLLIMTDIIFDVESDTVAHGAAAHAIDSLRQKRRGW